MCIDRRFDLTELLGVGLIQCREHRGHLGELGAHLSVDLVESGVDHILLRTEVGRGLFLHLRTRGVEVLLDLGRGGHELFGLALHRRLELLALQECRLFESGLNSGVSLRRGLLAGVSDGSVHCGIDRSLD